MKRIFLYLLTCSIIAVTISCKEKEESTDAVEETTEVVEKKVPEKRELTVNEKKMQSSVLAKAMSTREIGTFVSASVSAEITDVLGTEGPFTLFAPENKAFKALGTEKMQGYLNTNNKAGLKGLVENHIVSGTYDSATLVQDIKKSGSVKLETLSGLTLTVSMSGSDIIVSNPDGTKAKVGKSDITGSNGVIHILDTVLEGTK